MTVPWAKNLGNIDVENIEESLKDPKNLEELKKLVKEKIINKGGSTNDILGFPPGVLRYIYEMGNSTYLQGNVVMASNIFFLLTMIDSKDYKYFFGLAACLHKVKFYEIASSVYEASLRLNPNYPATLYHMADCYIQTNEKEKAKESLEKAIKLCEGHKEFDKIKSEADLMLQRL